MVHLNALAGPPRSFDVEVHAGILDVANGLIESLGSTLEEAITVAIIAVLAMHLFKNFTPVKLVASLVIGGLAWWILLLDGIQHIGGLFGDEVDEADTSSSAVIQTVDDPALPGPGADPGRL